MNDVLITCRLPPPVVKVGLKQKAVEIVFDRFYFCALGMLLNLEVEVLYRPVRGND